MNDIARAILTKNDVAVLATVTADGTPKAVPVHIAYDEKNIYWVSNAETVHSLNIGNDSRIALVSFDSHQTGNEPGEKGAVYLTSSAYELGGDDEVAARKIYFERYPDRNIDKFNEWSIYSAPIGQIDETKSRDAMVYYVNKGSNS
jgi:nitroimidazol reductase NimA-like FMN-containing flavoprotein (pyridoxamine 5'-phosphate oxidase superfamily)